MRDGQAGLGHPPRGGGGAGEGEERGLKGSERPEAMPRRISWLAASTRDKCMQQEAATKEYVGPQTRGLIHSQKCTCTTNVYMHVDMYMYLHIGENVYRVPKP